MITLRLSKTHKTIKTNSFYDDFINYSKEQLNDFINNQKKEYEGKLILLNQEFSNRKEHNNIINTLEKYYNEKEPGITRLTYFKNNGLCLECENYKDFSKNYHEEINYFNSCKKKLNEYESYIFTDEEINELFNIYDSRLQRIKEQEEIKAAKELEAQKQKEIDLENYLKTFKNGLEKVISNLNEDTHRLLNKEKEIQIYLNNGYKLKNYVTNSALIFLEPAENYIYTPEFESDLIVLYEAQNNKNKKGFNKLIAW